MVSSSGVGRRAASVSRGGWRELIAFRGGRGRTGPGRCPKGVLRDTAGRVASEWRSGIVAFGINGRRREGEFALPRRGRVCVDSDRSARGVWRLRSKLVGYSKCCEPKKRASQAMGGPLFSLIALSSPCCPEPLPAHMLALLGGFIDAALPPAMCDRRSPNEVDTVLSARFQGESSLQVPRAHHPLLRWTCSRSGRMCRDGHRTFVNDSARAPAAARGSCRR